MIPENRLIHRTLASLDEQRKAAGLAPLATPVGSSPRSAQANAQVQQQQYSQKLATEQAGSSQVKAATEANFAAKKTIADLSSLYENGSFTGTSDQMAELNDAQGKLNYTSKTLDAQSNIAGNAADTSGQQTLDAMGLAGQRQTYDPATGKTAAVPTDSRNPTGFTPEGAVVGDDRNINPVVNPNTGQSYTGAAGDRLAGRLTLANAQNILATSRNPKEREAAQKVIDDQVNNVKGYDQVPTYNEDGQIVGYSNVENSAKTQENQQKEKDRLALEESNRLKSQESKDALKKFTAGVDPAPVEQTKTQIDELMASIKNLSPDLQAAVLPSLVSLQQSNNDITKEVNNIIGSQPTDEEIQANYGSLEKYIQSEDSKYKALIERNMEAAKEVSAYNRDMLEAEKAIIEHDAAVAEQKQVIANAEGEKQLRRQLNRLGIQTDVQGLTYLQTEVQKGVDALENLKTANNLVSLKAQLAIGEGYRLEVKQAMETYEGNYLNITSQTTERLSAIKNSISTAKADRNKEIKEARKWGLEKKMANDNEAQKTIMNAYNTMYSAMSEQSKLRREGLKDAERFTTDMRGEIRLNPVLKDFKDITIQTSKMEDAWEKYQNGEVDVGTADQVLITLFNKLLDPTSVVREGEYLRSSEQQGLLRSLVATGAKAFLGGAGIDDAARESMITLARSITDEYNRRAQDELEPMFLQIEGHNTNFPGSPVDVSQVFNIDSIYLDDIQLNQLEDVYSTATGGTPKYTDAPTDISTGSSMLDGTISGYGSSAWEHGLDIATGGKPNPITAHIGGTVVGTVFDPSWKGSPNDPSGKKQNSGFGNQVKVKFDDGTEGWFSHLSTVGVQPNQRIEPGQILGNVGNTGYTMGPTGYHLDLTVVKEYKNGKPVYMSPQEIAVWMRGNRSLATNSSPNV